MQKAIRLVDADVLYDTISDVASSAHQDVMSVGNVLELIDSAHAVDAVKARRGEWIEILNSWGCRVGVKCSKCRRKVRNGGENYCPNCGAKNR